MNYAEENEVSLTITLHVRRRVPVLPPVQTAMLSDMVRNRAVKSYITYCTLQYGTQTNPLRGGTVLVRYGTVLYSKDLPYTIRLKDMVHV